VASIREFSAGASIATDLTPSHIQSLTEALWKSEGYALTGVEVEGTNQTISFTLQKSGHKHTVTWKKTQITRFLEDYTEVTHQAKHTEFYFTGSGVRTLGSMQPPQNTPLKPAPTDF
jgi:hypothetical protein